jgi:hypothetical protein
VQYAGGPAVVLRTTGAGGITVDGGTLRLATPFENEGTFGFMSPARVLLQSTVTNSGSFGGSDSLFVSNGTQFTNTGTVAPGLGGAAGILPTVVTSGALPFGEEGRLEIELGGTEPGAGYDRLDVEGDVALGGDLALSLLNDFVPELGQTFEVMTFTSRTGEFDTLTGTSLGNGLGLDPTYTDTSVILTVVEDSNVPPVAEDDSATTEEGMAVVVDVLDNDSDPDGNDDDLTVASVGDPPNGTAEILDDEVRVRYTPDDGFTGTDSFDYIVSDGSGGTDEGTVIVTVVEAGGTLPDAVNDTTTTQAAVTVFIEVLANDSDADGDTLRIESFTLPANGTAVVVAGEVFRYAPRAGFVGTDTFAYTVGDGNGGLDEAMVTVTVTEGGAPVPGTCTPGLASYDLDVNDVSARLYTTGTLFFDEGAGGQYVVPQASGVAAIFAAGVWVGGQVGGELRTAASTYASGIADPEFWPGPLGDDGRPVDPDDCSGFDRIYSVDRGAVSAYETTGDASDDLAEWPVGLGAPAVDADGERVIAESQQQVIDLEAGERPVLYGDRVAFWVMNDAGNVHTSSGRPPIGLEVRVLAFSYDDADPALDQSTIYRYELVNKGSAPFEDARFSLFLDADVGGALDDYVGSDPERGLGFAYNADNADDLYGSPPPAVGVDLFQGSGSLAYYSNNVGAATGDPTFGAGEDFYNYMRGLWRDGTPITEGGTGYRSGGPITPYAFPGDPEGEVFWSEVNADGEGGDLPPDDRRFVLAAPTFSLAPGEARTFDFAILFATGGDNLNSVTALKEASDELQARYDADELYREASEEASVVVEAPEEAATGSGLPVSASVAGFTPTSAELRYRPSGATTFLSTPLALNGMAYEGSVPPEAITLRGVEYYVALSDGERTVTFPAVDPEANPSRVRVRVAQQASGVVLPSDAEYRMVSVPLVLDDPSPLAVFGDDYGDYGPTSWRLLRHRPLAMDYAEFPELGADIVPGAGFWLAAYADDDGPFDVEDGLSVDASEPVLLTLPPGWSQIGNPFAFPVAWDAVLGSDLVQPPAAFDGVEYLLGQTVLDPWAGYFVLNDSEEAVTLEVPPTEFGLPTRPAAKGSEGEGYEIHLRADVAGRDLRDTQNVLGFADGAADEGGKDRLDRAEPPPIASHLRLSAVEGRRRLGHSFRPTGTDGAAWDLELTASPDVLAAGPLAVRVALEELGPRPDGFDVHVLDLDAETPLTLLEGAFDVTLSAEQSVRRFRLIAGADAFADAARQGISLVPVAFALAPAYPNPFAASVTLAYELPERADIVLDVFDLLGRRVAVLAEGAHDAGRYTARWDGTVAGAPAANGVYVYRLRAGSFTASHKVVLLR